MRVVKAQVTKTGESPSLATASGRLRRLASIAGSAPWHRPAALLWNWRFSTAASAVGTMAVASRPPRREEAMTFMSYFLLWMGGARRSDLRAGRSLARARGGPREGAARS